MTGEVRDLTAEVKLIDREREEARERRSEEAAALAALREEHEREKAAGEGLLTKRGRAVLAQHKRELVAVTGERDQARGQLVESTADFDEAIALAKQREAERDAARVERDQAERQRDAAVNGLTSAATRGERKGRADARAWAGKLVRRLLAGLGVAVGPETAAGRFVSALEANDRSGAERVIGDVERSVSRGAPGRRERVRRPGSGPSL